MVEMSATSPSGFGSGGPGASSAAYYGRHAAPAPPAAMECDEAPPPARKRAAPAERDAPAKRLRLRIYEIAETAPPTERRPVGAEHVVRATHNNPDISRCLMAYMI